MFYADEQMNNFKAVFIMASLEATLPFTYFNLRDSLIYKKHTQINTVGLVIYGSMVVLIAFICFLRNDNWKKYAQKFDGLSERKRIIGHLIVITLIITIITTSIISFQ
jgi:hypothetical protein